jgi:EmrB/QacA subfamily drug resistance transporter
MLHSPPHQAAPERPQGALKSPSANTVLLVLVVGTFLAPLDSSIVTIALPAISAEFGVQPALVSWVATAYLLTTASLLLGMGRLGDVWGLRRLYVWGLLIFGAGSLACALSGSIGALIASRVLQAVGASMLFAAGPALVTRTFPPERRGWALGYIALAVSAGLTVGPALGGVLLEKFGWPSLFLINVPLSVGVALLAWRLLPNEESVGEAFDLPGAFLAGLSLFALLVSLTLTESNSLVSIDVLMGFAVCIASLVGFLYVERRSPHPMVDLRLFSSRAFSFGLSAAALNYLALFSVTFNMPFYLLRVRGMDPRSAGIVLTTVPLLMAAFAPFAGRLSDRYGSRGLAAAGSAAIALGIGALSFVSVTTSLVPIVAALGVIGAGMAFFQTPNTAAVLRATPRSHIGTGSAFVAEARNVGMSIGIALTAAIVTSYLGGPLSGGAAGLPASEAARFVEGITAAYRVTALLALSAALMSWRTERSVEGGRGKP